MVFQAVSEQMFSESFLFLSQMVLMNTSVKGISFLNEIMGSSYSFSSTDIFLTHQDFFPKKKKNANIYKLEEKLVTHFKLEESSQVFMICFWHVGSSIYPN